MDAQEPQDPEKVSTIWVKYLNKIVNKVSNTKSSMIDMTPKDIIQTPFYWTKHIQKKPYYPKMDYIDIYINLANNMEIKKYG